LYRKEGKGKAERDLKRKAEEGRRGSAMNNLPLPFLSL